MPVLLLVAGLLAGCDPAAMLTKQGPQRGGVATEAIVGQVGSLNPLFAGDDNSRDVDSVVYQGLTRADGTQAAVPDLARSVTLDADGLTYVVKVRGDVRWADGQPLNASDVLFTYRLLQDPAYQEPSGQFWKEVTVELNGVDEVRFRLKAPDASFPFALRQAIIPRHVFQDIPLASMAGDPHSNGGAFGSGPFRVTSVSANHRVVTLARNPRSLPAPWLDSLVFRGYATFGDALDAVSRGEADALGALQPPALNAIERHPGLTVRELKTYSFSAALFNLSPDQSVYFNPPAVRQALVQGVDRGRLIREVLEGHADPSPGPIPPSDWAYDPRGAGKYPFDPAAARRTLDAAGWVLPPGAKVRRREGRDFSVSVVTADAYPYQPVAEALARQLAEIGVQVTVDAVPASTLVSRYLVGKKFQLALVAFDNGPDPDQFGFWHSSNLNDTLNFASALTPKQALIDKDLEDGRDTAERNQRKAAYADFQELMSDAAPALFLFEPHYAYILSARLHGVTTPPVVEPVDRLQHVSSWWVEVKKG